MKTTLLTRGPAALLPALAALLFLPAVAHAAVRQYWIAATPIGWNVVPSERDAIGRVLYTPAQTTLQTVVYKAYTRDWVSVAPNRPGTSGDNDGIPGPTIHARVGDTILVHFRNFDPNAPHSMHFHGVHYAFGSDGAYIPGFSGPGANVKPGETFTYRLVAAPDSVGVWPYHDHSPSMMASIDGGMYGALSILGRGERAPDREFVVFFGSLDGFMTIDGRAFVGNTPVFRAKVGDLVQWDVLALGDDTHTFHVHGHRWLGANGPQDVQTVGPAESFRIRWREDDPGTWFYHCHVESHMANGMIGIYRVTR